ncbi:hypothetical protein BKA69DRAFT_1054230 [Paraphysoderma sedebokerense]|nr:hypothetical protein BKA69DRAFT_1054230 [Paraphysoderma sedebokerense]
MTQTAGMPAAISESSGASTKAVLPCIVLVNWLAYHRPRCSIDQIIQYMIKLQLGKLSTDNEFYFSLFHAAVMGLSETCLNGSKVQQKLFRSVLLSMLPELVERYHREKYTSTENQIPNLQDLLSSVLNQLSGLKDILDLCTPMEGSEHSYPIILELTRSLMYYGMLPTNFMENSTWISQLGYNIDDLKAFMTPDQEITSTELDLLTNPLPVDNITKLVAKVATQMSAEHSKYSSIMFNAIQTWCTSNNRVALFLFSLQVLSQPEIMDLVHIYRPITELVTSLESVLTIWAFDVVTDAQQIKNNYQQFGSVALLLFTLCDRCMTANTVELVLNTQGTSVYSWIIGLHSRNSNQMAEQYQQHNDLINTWIIRLFSTQTNLTNAVAELITLTPLSVSLGITKPIFHRAVECAVSGVIGFDNLLNGYICLIDSAYSFLLLDAINVLLSSLVTTSVDAFPSLFNVLFELFTKHEVPLVVMVALENRLLKTLRIVTPNLASQSPEHLELKNKIDVLIEKIQNRSPFSLTRAEGLSCRAFSIALPVLLTEMLFLLPVSKQHIYPVAGILNRSRLSYSTVLNHLKNPVLPSPLESQVHLVDVELFSRSLSVVGMKAFAISLLEEIFLWIEKSEESQPVGEEDLKHIGEFTTTMFSLIPPHSSSPSLPAYQSTPYLLLTILLQDVIPGQLDHLMKLSEVEHSASSPSQSQKDSISNTTSEVDDLSTKAKILGYLSSFTILLVFSDFDVKRNLTVGHYLKRIFKENYVVQKFVNRLKSDIEYTLIADHNIGVKRQTLMKAFVKGFLNDGEWGSAEVFNFEETDQNDDGNQSALAGDSIMEE